MLADVIFEERNVESDVKSTIIKENVKTFVLTTVVERITMLK
jgi:hypothetical protein